MHKYFAGVNTVDELRQSYKELLKKHHPDNGGNLHIMQEINAEYRDYFSMHHAAVLQIVELLGEHFRRCAGNPPLQLHIVQRAISQMP